MNILFIFFVATVFQPIMIAVKFEKNEKERFLQLTSLLALEFNSRTVDLMLSFNNKFSVEFTRFIKISSMNCLYYECVIYVFNELIFTV